MPTTSMWTRAAACLALASASLLVTPRAAEACGGTFCDAGPGLMPVNQDGENVIFVLNPGEIEVHIQISYDPNTNAEQFSWLIPLAALPEFEVGSQPFFDALLSGSVPQYGLQTTFESCGDNGFGSEGSFDSAGGTGALSGGASTGEADPSGGPEKVYEGTVGAFDIVVLQDDTVGPIKQWLIDNGYQWVDQAESILGEYLAEGNLIAAFKLTHKAGLGDIHPIVLRYPSPDTCFPLRLTRVAAVEDMDIRVFVLANDRAAPTNFRHVLVNPLKIDWLAQATNYKEVISKAVDELMADGRAFVTEYAGPSDVVQPFVGGVYQATWDEAKFVGLDPAQVIGELNDQGLASCYDPEFCAFNHPLLEGLLLQHLPPPDGLPASEFYAYLAQYADQIDVMAWGDGAAFSAALADRVIAPGLHATDLLGTWSYLTRMYTTISPAEMTADPIFHTNPDLPEVASVRIANNLVLCDGNSVVTLPDGRQIYVPNGGPWPDIPGETWWAEEIQQVALKGQPMHIVNNTAAIDQKLEAWNRSHGWPRGEDSGGASGGLGSEEGGCSCRSDEGPGGALWLGSCALALAILRRRR